MRPHHTTRSGMTKLKLACIALWVALAGVVAVCFLVEPLPRKRKPPEFTPESFVNWSEARDFIKGEAVPDIEAKLAAWAKAPFYRRLRVVDYMARDLHYLVLSQSVREASVHRAVRFAETVLDAPLPELTQGDDDDVAEALEKAFLYGVEAARDRAMAQAAQERLSPSRLDELRSKYSDYVNPLKSHPDTCAEVMESLLAEWQPYGKPYEDLVSITRATGRSPRNSKMGVFLHDFDNGTSGTRYRFTLRNGRIHSISTCGIE